MIKKIISLFRWRARRRRRQERELKITEMAEMIIDAKRRLDDREKEKVKINSLVDLAEEILA